MAYSQTMPLNSADRTNSRNRNEPMPFYLAIPIWIVLAAIAWSPLLLIFRAFGS